MLDENEPEAAVVLWQILQDVTLWSIVPAELRGPDLFADEPHDPGDAVPDLRLDLSTLQVLVRDSHPDAAGIIAPICHRIATLAEEQGRTGTALCFFQAAALVDRANPRFAHAVAKQARRKADFARATVWYQRAIVLARRAGDWETEARSYSGLGILQWQIGNLGRAVELQERVVRIARRFHLREVRADALFDLAVLNYERGDPGAGLAAADQALRLYGPGHRQIPALAQNIAVCWMDYRGAFRQALDVLREMAVVLFRPTERVRLLANLARAAGGSGERDLFETAWVEALSRITENSREEAHADALLVLARGAMLLGDNERVAFACNRAMSVALGTQEQRVYLEAKKLLAETREVETQVRNVQVLAKEPADEERASAVEKLIRALRTCMQPHGEIDTTFTGVFAEPDSPAQAYALGMLFRQNAEYSSAALWFDRAKVLAERTGQWRLGAESRMRLANLKRQAGDLEGAVAIFREVRGLSQQFGFRDIKGAALHDLCVIEFERGHGDKGFAVAREAIEAHEPGSAILAKIAHDVAVFMMQNRGDYANALTVFRELENHTFRPPDQLLLWGSIARSAAGAGEMLVFERAWEEARRLIEHMGADQEHHAAALLNLAHGALGAGRIHWAEVVASQAREIAAARREDYVLTFADELLNLVASAKKSRVRPRPFSDPTHDAKDAGTLSRQLVNALRARGIRNQRTPPARTPA